MVTRNYNWSTEILWYETGYIKKRYYHSLNVMSGIDYIANYVLNC